MLQVQMQVQNSLAAGLTLRNSRQERGGSDLDKINWWMMLCGRQQEASEAHGN